MSANRKESVLSGEAEQRLKAAFLRDLSDAERLLLVLRYAENMSIAEVAQVMESDHDEIISCQQRLLAQLDRRLHAA